MQKNMTKEELKKIRANLTKVDIIDLALQFNMHEYSIRNILQGNRNNMKVIAAAITKAEKNKKRNQKLISKAKAL